MRSQTIVSGFFQWGFGPVMLCIAGLAACSSTPPAQAPDSNPSDTPPAAAGTESSIAGDVAADQKKNKFDEEQAKIVLARAANNAHTCVDVVDRSQPHGDATVVVTFSGKGKTTNATIAPPFEGTPIGQCATRAFVNIIVPPFEGGDVEMNYQVNLKPEAKGVKKDSGKAKK
jgi:hypothetical protein